MPSFCGISAVPMKLPGWMEATSTGLRTVTVQFGPSWMVCVLPASVFSVRVSFARLTIVPRATGGGPGGGWAAASPDSNRVDSDRTWSLVFIGAPGSFTEGSDSSSPLPGKAGKVREAA